MWLVLVCRYQKKQKTGLKVLEVSGCPGTGTVRLLGPLLYRIFSNVSPGVYYLTCTLEVRDQAFIGDSVYFLIHSTQ